MLVFDLCCLNNVSVIRVRFARPMFFGLTANSRTISVRYTVQKPAWARQRSEALLCTVIFAMLRFTDERANRMRGLESINSVTASATKSGGGLMLSPALI